MSSEQMVADPCEKVTPDEWEGRALSVVVRLVTRDDELVEPFIVKRHITKEVGDTLQVEEATCYCRGFEVPALVFTARAEDPETVRRLVAMVERLTPLMGREIFLRPLTHLDAADLPGPGA